MTTGSWSTGTIGSDYHATKSWNGADDPLKKRAENFYSSTMSVNARTKSKFYHNGVYVSDSYELDSNGILPTITSNDELEALSRLVTKIRGSDFNVAVFAAELPESVGTIVNSARAVLGSLYSIQKGDVGGALRSLGLTLGHRRHTAIKKQADRRLKVGDLSGAWLALQYGWLPLISDCYEAIKALEASLNSRQLTFRAFYKRKLTRNCSTSGYLSFPATLEARIGYKYTLYETPSAARNLGVYNPASVIWEKIPASFIVDWFIPVGKYLDVWSYVSGLKGRYVKSTMRSHDIKLNNTRMAYIGHPEDVVVGGTLRRHVHIFDRTVGTSLNVDLPSFKTLDQAFSLGHLKNAAALIEQLTAKSNWRKL